jgi:hypothetical protein
MNYKLLTDKDVVVFGVLRNDIWSIPFDPANTDYAEFKKAVTAGAELQDASGEVMSQADAEAFVKTLP